MFRLMRLEYVSVTYSTRKMVLMGGVLCVLWCEVMMDSENKKNVNVTVSMVPEALLHNIRYHNYIKVSIFLSQLVCPVWPGTELVNALLH